MRGDSSPTQTGTVKWNGVDRRYTDESGTYSQWANRNSENHPCRCVYYPVDEDYAGPADSTCETGCFSVSVDNGVSTTMWIDNRDRSPTVG
ncbi:MAG: hypothetical protein ACI9MR_002542 [Myxococcota bacterium]|jgi:hypothetical protein